MNVPNSAGSILTEIEKSTISQQDRKGPMGAAVVLVGPGNTCNVIWVPWETEGLNIVKRDLELALMGP